MEEQNIELRLIGITYNQIESGVYALILEDALERRRLAIVIGYPEAQSIECHLRKVRTPRPLAHDLLASMLATLEATLLRVDIHRLPSGPYAGKLTVEDKFGDIKMLDARSSDAIALAIRVGAPIYTSRELLDKEGFIPKENESKQKKGSVNVLPKEKDQHPNPYARYTLTQLQNLLEEKVQEENYESAAEIKKEIEKRSGEESQKTDGDAL